VPPVTTSLLVGAGISSLILLATGAQIVTDFPGLQLLRDLNHIQQTEELQNIKHLLGELANQAQFEAIEKTREARRVAALPKCPDCHRPLETRTPNRCSDCTSILVWITPQTAITAAAHEQGYDVSSDLRSDALIATLDTHIASIRDEGDKRIEAAVQSGFQTAREALEHYTHFLNDLSQSRAAIRKKIEAVEDQASTRSVAISLAIGVLSLLLAFWSIASGFAEVAYILFASCLAALCGGWYWVLTGMFDTPLLNPKRLPAHEEATKQLAAMGQFATYLTAAIDGRSQGILADNTVDGRPAWVASAEADKFLTASRLADFSQVWDQAISLWLTPIGLRVDYLTRNKETNAATKHEEILRRLRFAEAGNATPSQWLAVLPCLGLPAWLVHQGQQLLSWAVQDASLADALEAKYAQTISRLSTSKVSSNQSSPSIQESGVNDAQRVLNTFVELLAVPAVVGGKVPPQVFTTVISELRQRGLSESDAQYLYVEACKRIHRETPEKAVARLKTELAAMRRVEGPSLDPAQTWKALVAISNVATGDKNQIKALLLGMQQALASVD
jgi:hypothetical protein